MVDPVLRFDPPPRLDPTHDRVAIRLGQSRIHGHVIEGIAVGEEPPAFRAARMLACQCKLLRVDHLPIVRTGIRSAAL